MKLQELFEEKHYYTISDAGNVTWMREEGGDLTGAPEKVKGDFDAYNRKLTSLKGGPVGVGIDFHVSENSLTTLEGGPKHVGSNYYCGENKLTSLEGAPERIYGTFVCNSNHNLMSFKGGPKRVDRHFYARECSEITSFEGLPSHIGNTLDLSYCNKINSLVDVHKHIKHVKTIILSNCYGITEGGLGLLMIEGLGIVKTAGSAGNENYKKLKNAMAIINKYLGKGRAGLIDCQDELEEADLEEFAKL